MVRIVVEYCGQRKVYGPFYRRSGICRLVRARLERAGIEYRLHRVNDVEVAHLEMARWKKEKGIQ